MKNSNIIFSFLSKCLVILILFTTITFQYREMTVESDQLCSIMKKNKIKLGDKHNSAVLVKQTLLNSHSLKWRTNFHCSFQILAAHPKEGIFAVIQQLVFRINSTTDECIDYVQFKAKDGSTSQKYCGRFNADLKMDYFFSDSVALKASGNSFIDPKGELDVHIFVSRDELQSGEEMDLTIAFTAYKYCAGVDNSGWSMSDWVSCGDSYKDVCIYRDFISDGYVNCPYPGCVDEGGCSKRAEQEQNDKIYLGNKVFIGSISTLAVVFVVFVLFIWACKKHKILCWAETFAHPVRAETIAPPRASEMIDQTGERLSQSHLNQPSAPSIDEDKDLPPSYDSLFPER